MDGILSLVGAVMLLLIVVNNIFDARGDWMQRQHYLDNTSDTSVPVCRSAAHCTVSAIREVCVVVIEMSVAVFWSQNLIFSQKISFLDQEGTMSMRLMVLRVI